MDEPEVFITDHRFDGGSFGGGDQGKCRLCAKDASEHWPPPWNGVVCKGDWLLGTACGECARCYAAAPAVIFKLRRDLDLAKNPNVLDNTWTRIILRDADRQPARYFHFIEKGGPVGDPLNATYSAHQDASLLYLLESAQREYPTHAWRAVRLIVDVREFDDRTWEVVLDTAKREARRAALARIPAGDRKLLGLEEVT